MKVKFDIRGVVALYLFSVIFVLNLTKISDPDFFWHLKTGEKISQEGFLRADSFSWSFPLKEWHNHEWLSQVVFHLLYKHFGAGGLILVKAFLVTLAFGLLFLTILKKTSSFETAVFVTALSGWFSSITYSVRPQIFSFFLLSALIYLLFCQDKKQRLIPIIFLLWINLHGMFIVGLGALFIFALEETIKTGKFGALAKIFILSLLASLINPHGAGGILHPLKYLAGSTHIHLSYIMEWMSPDFHEPYGLGLFAFIAISVFSFAFSKEKPSLRNALLFLLFLFLALYSVRNVPLFLIVVSPFVAVHLKSAAASFPRPSPGSTGLLKIRPLADSKLLKPFNYFLALAALLLIFITFRTNFSDGFMDKTDYPANAVKILKKTGHKKILNPYRWGGYLIFNGLPVFIDGRADFYPGKFLEEFFLSTTLEKDPGKFLKKYDFDLIVWERNTPLSFYLGSSEKWKCIYSDKISEIYRKNGVRVKMGSVLFFPFR
ncbi:MAG: hypothetical protein ABIH68_07535 [bacterium]